MPFNCPSLFSQKFFTVTIIATMAPNTDIITRALIVTLKSPIGGKTSVEIVETTGINVQQINRIYARAIECGFDSNHRPLTLQDKWL